MRNCTFEEENLTFVASSAQTVPKGLTLDIAEREAYIELLVIKEILGLWYYLCETFKARQFYKEDVRRTCR